MILASLICILLAMQQADAATTIVSYTANSGAGPINPPWSSSGTNTYVQAQILETSGELAWRISDPGTAAVTGTTANRWYKHSVTGEPRGAMTQQGWEATMRLKIPDLLEDPSTATWSRNSNTWLSISMLNATAGNSTYALMFGRNASGVASVQGYQNAGVKSLSSGFHDYKILYDPSVSTTTAAVYIDGEFWQNITPSTNPTGTSAEIVWGDNLSQSSASEARTAYYANVALAIIPEPSRGLLMLISLSFLTLRRRRI